MRITRALAILGVLLMCAVVPSLSGTASMATSMRSTAAAAAATDCAIPSVSGAAVPRTASGSAAVRLTIGVAKTMNVSRQGQIIAVMVMFQETTLRNLANDGSSPQVNWPSPGRSYWLSVTRLSLKYPHDKFGSLDGAHDTDSIGLYQQRPAYGWGDYGSSTGVTDPEGVVQRLLDPRWAAMAFFGGVRSASTNTGLLDVPGWEGMSLSDAAEAVQGSTFGDRYAQWEPSATRLVDNNQDVPPIALPWRSGGGTGALTCTSIPSNPALGEAGRNPLGSLDVVGIQGPSIRVVGWAFDPDAINGINVVHFYDYGPYGTTGYPTGVANQPRDDVDRAFNVVGQFGFSTLLPWTGQGHHRICAFGINVGRGTGNPLLGCQDLELPAPIGSLDTVSTTAGGAIAVTGWAADPQAPGAAEQVHVYVTGPEGTVGTAGIMTGDARPDVQQAVSWAGPAQGFHAVVPNAGDGATTVCAYAIHVSSPGGNPQIGCRRVTVGVPPLGSLDAVTVVGNEARVAGWSFDPASPAVSITVHVNVDQLAHAASANLSRDDVNRAFGITGRHGFLATVPLHAGANQVCVYSIGLAPGNNPRIGCRSVRPAVNAVGPQTAPTTTASMTTAPTATATATATASATATPTPVVSTPVPSTQSSAPSSP